MIKGGVDINKKVGNKILFIIVCYNVYVYVVKKLIEVGVDVNLWNEFILFLEVVCYEGYLSIVKELYKVEYNGN